MDHMYLNCEIHWDTNNTNRMTSISKERNWNKKPILQAEPDNIDRNTNEIITQISTKVEF